MTLSSRPGVIVEEARAKINLYLHVTGRRSDGYHLLDSLVGFASIADRVHVAASTDSPGLTVSGPMAGEVPRGADNLAWQAAAQLAEHAGRASDIAVHLDKALPVAAGVGGGSADAAAVLRALIRLWNLDPQDPQIALLSEGLGADVPVCLLGGQSAFVGGIGEDLYPGPPLAGLAVVLVNPRVPLPTAAVFRARTGAFSHPGRFVNSSDLPDNLIRQLRNLGNDLMAPARQLCPAIGDVLDALELAPACQLARMSGSGPTCFGLFPSQSAADEAAARLLAEHPDWWVQAGQFV